MHHLTYVQAIFTGIVQGVTELFPISSLGHNVLLPALIGGSWAQNLSVSAPGSPYLAFVVGLHVATALAMIIYFRRDWARIIKAFIASIRNRRIATTDERLAWMLVLATIPVGLVGATLQKVFTHVFAKPTLTAFFLAVNGVILLYSERQRRARASVEDGARLAPDGGYSEGGYYDDGYRDPGYGDGHGYRDAGGYRDGRYGGGGYSEQPQQQQWQGPYGDQEPPRPSFTPHPQPSGGASPGGGGRDPRQGRDAGEGDWSQWYSRDEGARQQRPYDGGRGYEAGGGHGQDRGYERGPAYGGGPEYGGASGYGGDPRYGGGRGYGGGPEYGGAPGHERTVQYDRAAGYDPRYGGAQGRAAYEDERAVHQYDEDSAVAADERLSGMSFRQAIVVGSWQILALLPGISRDGIVTVAGMGKGLRREDAVRFSFLLSAPVILAAGVLKASDLFGPEGKGIHGPVLVGSLFAGVGAFLSVRFLTKYFSESRSLKPFGIYCLVFGVLSMAYLMVK